MKIHAISGGGGLGLHVREWGNPRGRPILFIHGWSQAHMCWSRQYEGSLADQFRIVAMDLRGHGMSAAPLDAAHYVDGDLWADDVAAVIDGLGLAQVTLVGWSYGGFVIGDYLRRHGEQRLAGINLVGAAIMLNDRALTDLIGPDFIRYAPAASSADAPTAIAAVCDFLKTCCAEPVSREDFEVALAYNMLTSSAVRGFLAQRDLDFTDVLSRLTVPVLVSQGRLDSIVLPQMAEHILAHCPTARASWYEKAGHAPFLEDTDRFNRELAAFAMSPVGVA